MKGRKRAAERPTVLHIITPAHRGSRVGSLVWCLMMLGRVCAECGYEVQRLERETWGTDFGGDLPGEKWIATVA